MPQPNPSPRGTGAAVQPGQGGDTRQYLTFSVGSEMFAVGILNVKEIIEYGNLTEIPMMPNFIRGVINLRGAVVPVIDLGARFSGRISAVQRRTCIVIVEVQQDDEKLDIGIMVDAVSEVLEIPGADIEPAPSFGAHIRADFIAGMGKVAGKFVIILNIQRVLSVDEMTVLTQIGQGKHEAPHGA
ncbi:chemotaxis protein CheW [Parapusillimonas granuli]|uniref:Purine-binding chemotaxis protein CheW n=1 Tax=Parapusillimonas granuli TaxID=380911 RepID=A0A853FVY6_9BURK|nr:chemotaxis protein CheW [Parapusillimonas granuli]MBB5213440.1 purine-binding chemotaxis protein CheW [Parapusillimonas granuli]MEB2398540.1 chemotaxis protein CheW [Alcaligenaceae bacterium]NYT48279.1 purine-binding chemotaxis protein CheW [Parapusillimonas granuli]